jgi:hypothetical protein
MLTDMSHTAVLTLGFVLLALALACGDTQPPAPTIEPTSTPDIKATVEAKMEERLRIDATVEARVELAKASLVAPRLPRYPLTLLYLPTPLHQPLK